MIVGVIAYFRHAPWAAAHDAPCAAIPRAGGHDGVFVVEAALAYGQLPLAIAERDSVALEAKRTPCANSREHVARLRRQSYDGDRGALGNRFARASRLRKRRRVPAAEDRGE